MSESLSDLQSLMAEQAAINAKVEAARVAARNDAIANVKAIMGEAGISVADLGLPAPTAAVRVRGQRKDKGAKLPPKYALGNDTWCGRGAVPAWFKAATAAGRAPESMLVAGGGGSGPIKPA